MKKTTHVPSAPADTSRMMCLDCARDAHLQKHLSSPDSPTKTTPPLEFRRGEAHTFGGSLSGAAMGTASEGSAWPPLISAALHYLDKWITCVGPWSHRSKLASPCSYTKLHRRCLLSDLTGLPAMVRASEGIYHVLEESAVLNACLQLARGRRRCWTALWKLGFASAWIGKLISEPTQRMILFTHGRWQQFNATPEVSQGRNQADIFLKSYCTFCAMRVAAASRFVSFSASFRRLFAAILALPGNSRPFRKRRMWTSTKCAGSIRFDYGSKGRACRPVKSWLNPGNSL